MTPSKGKRSRCARRRKAGPLTFGRAKRCSRCWADAPRRRDLLIEFLHLIQDHFGCLSAAHLVALAAEMKMAMAEVYEVATFYHHFDVVKEGDAPPPAITVRVCDSIACELAGSRSCFTRLPRTQLGPAVDARRRRSRGAGAMRRSLRHRPCRGRGSESGAARHE